MNKVVVTGAAGFVGSTLSAALIAQGYSVVGIDSLTDYYSRDNKQSNLDRLNSKNFTFVNNDLNDMDLVPVLEDARFVFHQAGQPGVRMSWGSDFDVYTRQNIEATQKLLEAARVSPALEKLVYASSSSVYGNAESYPTSEDVRPQPVSPYGVTKLAAEHLCGLYASNYGVPTVSLRYFTVFGPRQRPDMAFTRFLRASQDGSEIRIFGDGSQVRDFTFVDDVVAANIQAAQAALEPGEVLNVAGGTNVSVNEVLDVIRELSGNALDVKYVQKVAGDVKRTGGDTARIKALVGWQPVMSLAEGLSRQLDWVRSLNLDVAHSA